MKSQPSSLFHKSLPVAVVLSCIFAFGFAASQTDGELEQMVENAGAGTQQADSPQPPVDERVTLRWSGEDSLFVLPDRGTRRSPTRFPIWMSRPGEAENVTGTGEAMLGVHVRKAGETLRSQLKIEGRFGLVIEHVTADSAAEKGELQAHDMLYKLDGQILINVEQFQTLIDAKEPGDEIEIEFFRNGDSAKLTIELSERKVTAAVSSLDALNESHRDILIHALKQQDGEDRSVNLHNVAVRYLNCRACHTGTEPANSQALLQSLEYHISPGKSEKGSSPDNSDD